MASPMIGRIAGIPIRVHPTFLLLGFLVVLSTDPTAFLGMLAMVFGSVVVHELAHALTARRRGAVVRDIVLLPIGGVSEMEALPESPRDELAVAAAGPVMSLAIAVGAAVVAIAVGGRLFPPTLVGGAVFARLAWLNVLLGGFNLLPAFPLDGGRVFHAALTTRYGSESATRIATKVGRALGAAMIAVGLLADIWLVVIGVFVFHGASTEGAAAIAHARLRGLRVADAMVHTPIVLGLLNDAVTVEASEPLEDAAVRVAAAGQESAAVLRAGRVVGLLRLEDVVRRVAADTKEVER